MGIEYTFYDYIDADGDGTNVIKSWLNGVGNPAKARFIMEISQLEASPPSGFMDSVWKPPYAYDLKGSWKGFTEIRVKLDKIRYRLIGKKINRDVLLVTWGLHDGQGWHTGIPPGTAKIRVNQMVANPLKYRREHEL
jgi:hypothetical protein